MIEIYLREDVTLETIEKLTYVLSRFTENFSVLAAIYDEVPAINLVINANKTTIAIRLTEEDVNELESLLPEIDLMIDLLRSEESMLAKVMRYKLQSDNIKKIALFCAKFFV